MGIFYNGKEITPIIQAPNAYEPINKMSSMISGDITAITPMDLMGITKIKSHAFYNCDKLVVLSKIPDEITNIGEKAFYNCNTLIEIELGNGITTIGAEAFANCSALTKIKINAIIPPVLEDENVFDNTNNCIIYVPSESVSTYKTANIWNLFQNRIEAI